MEQIYITSFNRPLFRGSSDGVNPQHMVTVFRLFVAPGFVELCMDRLQTAYLQPHRLIVK